MPINVQQGLHKLISYSLITWYFAAKKLAMELSFVLCLVIYQVAAGTQVQSSVWEVRTNVTMMLPKHLTVSHTIVNGDYSLFHLVGTLENVLDEEKTCANSRNYFAHVLPK